MVPNPYTLLYLKDAFFSLPLAPKSQDLFAFEWMDPEKGINDQLTWIQKFTDHLRWGLTRRLGWVPVRAPSFDLIAICTWYPVGSGRPGHMPARHQGLAPDNSGSRITGLSSKTPDLKSRGEQPRVHIRGWTKMVDRNHLKNPTAAGSLGGAAVWRLPLAQGAILETRDRIPRRAPGAWSLLLPLPMSLPLFFSLSLSLSVWLS